MATRNFTIHGVGLRLRCETALQADRVAQLLSRLFEVVESNPQTAQAVRISLRSDPYSPEMTPGREIYRSELLHVFETGNGHSIRCGASSLDLDLAANAGDGCLADGFWTMPLQVQRAFFFLPLLFLLPRHGFYGLHANGLVRNGVGFLIAGGSGRGKTTLTLSLLRQGWSYLSDDTIMLRAAAAGIEALTFRRGFACTRDTLARFPEFDRTPSAAPGWKADKTLVEVDGLYPGRRVNRCDPRVILLPEVARTPRSSIQPLRPGTALSMLVQQSPGVLTRRASVEEQMQVLRRLVTATHHWRVLLGTDVYEDGAAVSRLLWGAREPSGNGQDRY